MFKGDTKDRVKALFRGKRNRASEQADIGAAPEPEDKPLNEIITAWLSRQEAKRSRQDREELVRALYQVMLVREPEAEVINQWVMSQAPIEELLASFVTSDEVATAPWNQMLVKILGLNASRRRTQIDVDVPPEQLDQMFQRIQKEWSDLGETDPFWSVLTFDQFRKEAIDEHMSAFLETGQSNVDDLFTLAERTNQVLDRSGTVVDFGCGVGRLTLALADRFKKVIGVDISPGNLREAKALVAAREVTNIDFVEMQKVQDIKDLPAYDLLYTAIVLQHNPPPVQRYMLDGLLAKAKPGGRVFFQIPTHIPGYAFSAERYLKDGLHIMEMHALPMHEIFALFTAHGFEVLEVYQDYLTAMAGSHSFFAIKR